MRNFFLLFIGISIILMCSCKSRKMTQNVVTTNKTDQEIIESIDQHNFDYHWFSAKSKIRLQSDLQNLAGRAQVRIKRDSLIWINIKKILNVARVQITPDSVYIIYNLERAFERGTVEEYSRIYGIDLSFSRLQDFFVGNCLTPDEPASINRTSQSYHVNARSGTYDVDYKLDPLLLLNYFSVENSDGQTVSIAYSDYKKTDQNVLYSHSRTYNAPIDNTANAKLDISISSVEFNVKKNTPFNIPSHYIEYR